MSEIEIRIPAAVEPDPEEIQIPCCSMECPFRNYDRIDGATCSMHWAIDNEDYDDMESHPGPSCPGPGMYRLVRVEVQP